MTALRAAHPTPLMGPSDAGGAAARPARSASSAPSKNWRAGPSGGRAPATPRRAARGVARAAPKSAVQRLHRPSAAARDEAANPGLTKCRKSAAARARDLKRLLARNKELPAAAREHVEAKLLALSDRSKLNIEKTRKAKFKRVKQKQYSMIKFFG
eukprot:GHVT01004608.1.p1 GENE.GHVT01004608.1~~GHVT01004608.1.p1  ORF type:complete len:156 (+),score=38.51 GHVT01004608.1:102-569(+)